MSFETGKFIYKYLKGKSIDMYIGDQAESLNYSDTDMSSYAVLVGVVKDYDEDSGIITLISEQGRVFYVAEVKVGVFWESDSSFNILEVTKSTLRNSKNGKDRMKKPKKHRDIM